MAICSSACLREHNPAFERNLFKRTVSPFFGWALVTLISVELLWNFISVKFSDEF